MSSNADRESSASTRRKKGPGSQALRKGRISLPNRYYYLTKKTLYRDSRPLIGAGVAQVIVDSLFWAQNEQHWKLLAFVVMPDHYHVVIALGGRKSLRELMKSINHHNALAINKIRGTHGSFWQEGFHDRSIRPHEDLNDYVTYVHMNPVRAGLVEHPEDWPWSSARAAYRDKMKWD
jgi:putative transposase